MTIPPPSETLFHNVIRKYPRQLEMKQNTWLRAVKEKQRKKQEKNKETKKQRKKQNKKTKNKKIKKKEKRDFLPAL